MTTRMHPWPSIVTARRSSFSCGLSPVKTNGATVKEPAHDVGGGRLVATVTDPDGNVLGLLQDR
jgi:predicted enzyme related to lactoylglutathione lyase